MEERGDSIQRCLDNDDAVILKRLIHSGYDVNKSPTEWFLPWMHTNISLIPCAAGHGKINCLQELLQHGDKFEHYSGELSRAVADACQTGQHECLHLLLQHKAYLSIILTSGYSPVHIVAGRNDARCLRLLLDHGAKPGAETAYPVDKPPTTPIQLTSDVHCLRLLLQHGAKCSATVSLYHQFMKAEDEQKAAELVALLLEYSVPADVTDSGLLPLPYAVQRGLLGCAAAFIKAGVTPSNAGDKTLLLVAANHVDETVRRTLVELLLTHADPETKTTWFRDNTLMQTVIMNDYVGVLELVILHGMDVFKEVNKLHVTYQRYYWLVRAAGKDFEASKVFLRMCEVARGRDLDVWNAGREQYGENILHLSASALNVSHIEALLRCGCDPNILTRGGASPVDVVMEHAQKELHSDELETDVGASVRCFAALIRAGGQPSNIDAYDSYLVALFESALERGDLYFRRSTPVNAHVQKLFSSLLATHFSMIYHGCPGYRAPALRLWTEMIKFIPKAIKSWPAISADLLPNSALYPPFSLKHLCRDAIRRTVAAPQELKTLDLPHQLQKDLNFSEFEVMLAEYRTDVLTCLNQSLGDETVEERLEAAEMYGFRQSDPAYVSSSDDSGSNSDSS